MQLHLLVHMFLKVDVEFHQFHNAPRVESMRKRKLGDVLHRHMLVVNFFKSQTPFKTLEEKHRHFGCHKNQVDLYSYCKESLGPLGTENHSITTCSCGSVKNKFCHRLVQSSQDILNSVFAVQTVLLEKKMSLFINHHLKK